MSVNDEVGRLQKAGQKDRLGLEAQRMEDYEWALDRVTRMCASALVDAQVYRQKLLKGFGYPNEIFSRAQDYRALSIILSALQQAQARPRLEPCQHNLDYRNCSECAAPPRERGEQQEAHGYLSRLFTHYAPQCEPLPSLLGVCTQIDNLLVGLARERSGQAAAPQWQPIETAPTDGSWMWARFGLKNQRVTMLRFDAEMSGGMWMSGTGYWHDHGPFTHWAPLNAQPPALPPPPARAEQPIRDRLLRLADELEHDDPATGGCAAEWLRARAEQE